MSCRQAFHVFPAQMAEWKAYFLLDDALTGSLGSLEAACQTLPGAIAPAASLLATACRCQQPAGGMSGNGTLACCAYATSSASCNHPVLAHGDPAYPTKWKGVLSDKSSGWHTFCSGSGARQQLQAGADPGIPGQTQGSTRTAQGPTLQHIRAA